MSTNLAGNRSKSEIKRQLIIDAATSLFCSKGYAGISMEFIAKQAGVSKQTIYSHFGNKDELFFCAISCKCEAAHMLDRIDDISDPKATLISAATRFIEMVTSKESLAVHKICAYEADTYPHLSQLFFEAGPERLINDVTELMNKLNDEGHLSIGNPHYAAVQFLTAIKGEIWLRAEFKTEKQISNAERTNYIEATVDMFIRAYSSTGEITKSKSPNETC